MDVLDEFIVQCDQASSQDRLWLGSQKVHGGNYHIDKLRKLCASISRTNSFQLGLTDNDFGDVGFEQILTAAASNQKLHRWVFDNCNIRGKSGLALAKALRSASHVNFLSIVNNPLSGKAISALVDAALQLESLEGFRLVDYVEVELTEEIISKLLALRRKFPTVVFGSGPMCRLIEAAIAMRSLANPETEMAVRRYQQDIHKAVAEGATEEQVSLFNHLVRTAQVEHQRLEELLDPLMDKYVLLNGFQYIEQLRPVESHDSNNPQHGRAPRLSLNCAKGVPVNQIIPAALSNRPEEEQLTWLLAEAAYREESIRKLCSQLTHDINSADSVEDIIEMYDFGSKQLHLPVVRITDCEEHPDVNGEYLCIGFSEGRQLFRKKAEDSNCAQTFYLDFRDKHKLFYIPRGWAIERCINGSWPLMVCPIELGDDTDTGVPCERGWDVWLEHCKRKPSKLQTKMDMRQRSLQEVVEDDIEPLVSNSALLQQTCQRVELLFGPPKGFHRAQQKGVRSLSDLNRVTLNIDRPMTLILAVFMLQELAQKSGGTISRMKNKLVLQDLTEPPNLHVNVCIDGWSYEVQMTFTDFLTVKHNMHKYYTIIRAKSVAEISMPIFNPLPQEIKIGGVPYRWQSGKLESTDPPEPAFTRMVSRTASERQKKTPQMQDLYEFLEISPED